MSTQIIYVKGKAKWARVFEDQMDTKFGEKFHITIYPDEESKIILKSAGVRLKEKTDEEGSYFKFSRDNKKEFNGKEEIMGPPKLVDAANAPFDKRIGNGSMVTAKLAVYDSEKGKGTRLEAVRIDEHVAYEDYASYDVPF